MRAAHFKTKLTVFVAMVLYLVVGTESPASAQSKKKKNAAEVDLVGLIRTFEGHDGPATAVAYSPTGKFVVSGGRDKSVRTWDLKSGKQVHFLQGLNAQVNSLAVIPGGRFVVSGGGNHSDLRIWDLNTGLPAQSLTGYGHGTQSVTITRDGRVVGAACGDAHIHFWNTTTGAKIASIDTQVNSRTIGLSPDGKLVAAVCVENETVRMWETNGGRPVRIFKDDVAVVHTLAFSPDGKHLATGCDDKIVRIWKLDTEKPLKSLQQHEALVRSVTFSPDGKRLLTGGDDNHVIVWDLENSSVLNLFAGHTKGVTSVAFSPDGKRAVSSSADGTVRLWGIPN